jgi:hypothetical protein
MLTGRCLQLTPVLVKQLSARIWHDAWQKQVLDLEERLLSCPPAAAASHHHCARSYGGGGERGALQESAAGLEAVSEYPPLGAVKADHARQVSSWPVTPFLHGSNLGGVGALGP